MKSKRVLAMFVGILLSLSLVLNAGSAQAATSDVIAWLDWSTFTYTGDIAWTHKDSYSWAYAENYTNDDAQEDYSMGWVLTEAEASVDNADSSSDTAPAGAYGWFDVYSEAYATTNSTNLFAMTEGYASLLGEFTALSDTTVTFSVDSHIIMNLSAELGETANGSARAGLYADNEFVDFLVENDENFQGMKFLEISFSLDKDKTGSLAASAFTSTNVSAVPIPGAVWLFGSGLVGLAGIRRKRLTK